MANVLVNDKWLELKTDGMSVAQLLSGLSDDGHVVEFTTNLGVKADGQVLTHSDSINSQQTIEVIELPDADDFGSVAGADDVDSTDADRP